MSQIVTVKNVRGLNSKAQREGIAYVGRGFAGWTSTEWGNHFRHVCPHEFREHLESLDPAQLAAMLVRLWDYCHHGAKPLGCWCLDWDGTGETPACHAAVWAEKLNALRSVPSPLDCLRDSVKKE